MICFFLPKKKKFTLIELSLCTLYAAVCRSSIPSWIQSHSQTHQRIGTKRGRRGRRRGVFIFSEKILCTCCFWLDWIQTSPFFVLFILRWDGRGINTSSICCAKVHLFLSLFSFLRFLSNFFFFFFKDE